MIFSSPSPLLSPFLPSFLSRFPLLFLFLSPVGICSLPDQIPLHFTLFTEYPHIHIHSDCRDHTFGVSPDLVLHNCQVVPSQMKVVELQLLFDILNTSHVVSTGCLDTTSPLPVALLVDRQTISSRLRTFFSYVTTTSGSVSLQDLDRRLTILSVFTITVLPVDLNNH